MQKPVYTITDDNDVINTLRNTFDSLSSAPVGNFTARDFLRGRFVLVTKHVLGYDRNAFRKQPIMLMGLVVPEHFRSHICTLQQPVSSAMTPQKLREQLKEDPNFFVGKTTPLIHKPHTADFRDLGFFVSRDVAIRTFAHAKLNPL